MRRRSPRPDSWTGEEGGRRHDRGRDLGKRKRDGVEETVVDRKYRRREEELVSNRTSR